MFGTLLQSTKARRISQVKRIGVAALLMVLGIGIFKYVPMYMWGTDILFDASAHLTGGFFVLYIAWFFIDQNKQFHFPFFLLSVVVLFIIAVQRILVSAHNDVGLLLALIISLVSIGIAERKQLAHAFDF